MKTVGTERAAMRVLSSVLSPRLRAPLLPRNRAASSGSMQIRDPLNFWAGRRVSLEGELGSEPVYEPATGDSFWSRPHKH